MMIVTCMRKYMPHTIILNTQNPEHRKHPPTCVHKTGHKMPVNRSDTNHREPA
jgi:hypothetical protein